MAPVPPSPFALRMRPWLLSVLSLLLLVAAARFVTYDLFSGFFMALTVGIGWYAVHEGMDMAWILCLAIIFFLNAIFDSFIIAARAVRAEVPLFSKYYPWTTNVLHGTICAGPLLEMIAAVLCW